MKCLVLARLDYGNTSLAGIPYIPAQATSVGDKLSCPAGVLIVAVRPHHITPLLRQLHWLKARKRIDFNLTLLVYKCQHGAALSYLADELSHRRTSRLDVLRRSSRLNHVSLSAAILLCLRSDTVNFAHSNRSCYLHCTCDAEGYRQCRLFNGYRLLGYIHNTSCWGCNR